jgi:hypothetical protein
MQEVLHSFAVSTESYYIIPALAGEIPETPAQHGQPGSELSTVAVEGRPEIAKTSPIGISLACLIGKLYGFAGFEVVPEVVSDRSQPQNAVRMHSAPLDALLRFVNCCLAKAKAEAGEHFISRVHAPDIL